MIESIKQSLEKLSELSLAEVEALIASAYTEFESADKDGEVEDMREYLVAAKTASVRRDELVAAAAVAEAEAPAAAEPEATVTPDPDPEPAPEPEATPDPEPEPEVEVEPEKEDEPEAEKAEGDVKAEDTEESEDQTEVTDEVSETDKPAEAEAVTESDATAEVEAETDTSNKEETAMAASATEFKAPEENAPVPVASTTAVIAAGDVHGVSAGAAFKTETDVAQAMLQKVNSLRRVSTGDGEQVSVATVVASIPESRMLEPGAAEDNARKIKDVTGEEALVAAGGYCAPLEVRYDIFGLGSAARPVRDALVGFGTSRGGIRYVAPPVLGDLEGAVSLWTAANDADPTPDPAVKPKLIVECAPELTAVADAVTLQLQFGNLMTRAFPELVSRNNELALIEHARFAELTLLSKMAGLSTAVTSSYKLGVARDFLHAIGKGAAAYRSRHRLGRTTNLRVVAPEWVLDAMREDLAQGLPGDTGLAYADATISGFLSARNVRISWHLDGIFSAQGVGALVDFPTSFQWFIFAEGTFLFLDGGTLDLGVVRDSTLVGTNDYITFVETFEGVAKVGVESMVVTTTSEVEGAVVGTIEPTPGDTVGS